MGTTFSKVKLKDGSVRYVKDSTARQLIESLQTSVTNIQTLIEDIAVSVQQMPAPSSTYVNQIYQYMGDTNEHYHQGDLYICVYDQEGEQYIWQQITYNKEEIDQITQNIYDTIAGERIQVSTMPTAAAAEIGKVYQYIGETGQDYTKGYFYECSSSDPNAGSYTAPDGKTYTFKYHIFIGHHTTNAVRYNTQYDFYVYSNIRMCSAPYNMNYSGDVWHIYYYDETYASNNHLRALGSWDTSSNFYQDWSNSPDQPSGSRWEYYVRSINPHQEYGWDCNTYDMKVFENNEPASEVVAYLNSSIFEWNRINTQPEAPVQLQADWNQNDSSALDYIKNKPDIENIQVEIMPEASIAEAGNIYQYIGETDTNYTNGYFYKCFKDPLVGEYADPNGKVYNYKTPFYSSYIGGSYIFYTNYRVCGSKQKYYTSSGQTYYYLLYCLPTTSGGTALCESSWSASSYYITGYPTVVYPVPSSLANNSNDSCLTLSNGDPNRYNWEPWMLESEFESAGIPLFDTNEEAYNYSKAPAFIWERINTQPTPVIPEVPVIDVQVNGTSVVNDGIAEVETQIIQVETIPTAAASEVNKIYEYIGTTTNDYINGYFYKCIGVDKEKTNLAPNGNYYIYKYPCSTGSYNTRYFYIYSDKKVCTCAEYVYSTDYRNLLGLCESYDGTSSMASFSTRNYTSNVYPFNKYPSSGSSYLTDTGYYIWTQNTGEAPSYNNELYNYNVTLDVPDFETKEEAYAYLLEPDLVYIWERIDVQPQPVIPEIPVTDVQVNGTSVVNDGVAEVETQIIQVETMPNADTSAAGKIYQYVGTTTNDYVNGYFYKRVSKAPEAIYTAPDGNKYKHYYEWTYANGFGWTVYSDVPMCAINERYATANYGTYDANTMVFYGHPNGEGNPNDLIEVRESQTTATSYSNYTDSFGNPIRIYIPISANSICMAVPDNGSGNVDTWLSGSDAITYLSAPDLVYVWERVDVQPAPAAHEDEVLRKEIGNLTDALGKTELYKNYIYNKNSNDIIEFEKEVGSGQNPSIVKGTFDPLLKTLKFTLVSRASAGSVVILDGDDLFETKLSKNLPNGTYAFYGEYVNFTTDVYMRVCQCNENDPTNIDVVEYRFNTAPSPISFTIDDTYDYNWIEIGVYTPNYNSSHCDEYKIAVLKQEPIYATMNRPKVPMNYAEFTDHTYQLVTEASAGYSSVPDGSIGLMQNSYYPPTDSPMVPITPGQIGYAKVKGWDDLVNSIPVEIRGNVDNSSVNAGVTKTIATFEFYNGNTSQDQDIVLEGVLNFAVNIVNYENPTSILFVVYDNETLVESYTIGIDTDGYKYINFKHVVSGNIGIGNKLYKVKMTPTNCNII